MKGQDVEDLQFALAQLEYNTEIDGVFGYITEKNVKRVQRSKGLKPNGVVGKVLRRHLRLGEFHA